MGIVDRINNNLGVLFDVEDQIYRSYICDKYGSIPGTISIPTDIDIGAIASQIEYLRLLSIDLVSQLFIDEASGDFLKYQLEEFFNSLRLENETDSDWVDRTIAQVFSHKVSNATIIYSLRPFSSAEPEIALGSTSPMFADRSFAGRYRRYDTTSPYDGSTFTVFPAYSKSEESSLFSVIITLYDADPSDYFTIVSLIDKYLAAGISFILINKITP